MQSIAKLSVKRNRIICLCFILLIVLAILASVLIISKHKEKASDYVFGEQALKIDGKIIETSVFRDEQNKFFERWKSNSEMIQKTDEEINDLVLEEVIKKVLADNYFCNESGKKATQKEIDDYYNKYVKASEEAYGGGDSSVNDGLDYKSEAEKKKEVELYLLKLKSISDIVKDYGISVSEKELDEKYTEYSQQYKEMPQLLHPKEDFRSMLLIQKFSTSDSFNNWIEKLRNKAKIEILEPALNAYRFYKKGEYDKAEQEYKKAYKKYKKSFYLDKEKECKKKK